MKFEVNIVHNGDCLDIMPHLPDNSIDIVLCDLPYACTKNTWDSPINLPKLWIQYNRIVKPNGAIILFGQNIFSAILMLSNVESHRYNLVWEKTTPTGHLNAKIMPMRIHEDILVFYKKLPTYNPQKTFGHKRKVSTSEHKRNSVKTSNYGAHGLTSYDSTERYPTSILKFSTDRQKSALHPTQKPLALCEYLIKTYSNENDIILDNCCGSGTTLEAAGNTNRRWIGIDKEKKYCKISIERTKQAIADAIINHLNK